MNVLEILEVSILVFVSNFIYAIAKQKILYYSRVVPTINTIPNINRLNTHKHHHYRKALTIVPNTPTILVIAIYQPIKIINNNNNNRNNNNITIKHHNNRVIISSPSLSNQVHHHTDLNPISTPSFNMRITNIIKSLINLTP